MYLTVISRQDYITRILHLVAATLSTVIFIYEPVCSVQSAKLQLALISWSVAFGIQTFDSGGTWSSYGLKIIAKSS
jgi:hypothetical protein